jgi:uncharacterized Ntn-hydrolase superfamily protein
MTFAIVARDPETGQFGVAKTTRTMAAGGLDTHRHVPMMGLCLGISNVGRCHKVGALMISNGLGADAAMKTMIAADEHIAYRQLAVIDHKGVVRGYTGPNCFAYAGHEIGDNFIVTGNVLTSPATIEGMARGFLESKGQPFARRLLASLEGGRDAGGQLGGQRSADISVYGDREGALLDLRIDLNPDPVAELVRLYDVFTPLVPYYELHRLAPNGLPRADDWLKQQAQAKA